MADPSPNTSSLLDAYLANMEANTRAGIDQSTGSAIPSANGNDVTVQASARPQPNVPTASAAPVAQDLQPSDPNIDMGQLQSPTAPTLNYDNSRSVAAVQQANAASTPQGGSSNPGLYGLLPSNLQHGTLRNVLGALGDAFLVQGGGQPEYANNMARQQVGDAMAGMNMNDPNSVQAAVQRVAATGSPGANEMADKIQSQAQQAAMTRAQMAYTNQQRQQMNQIRFNGLYGNIGKAASGMLSTATSANYPQIYASLDNRIKHIDPEESAATALDIPMPQDFQEGALANYGMTGNNVQQSSDRAAERDVQVKDTDTRAGATVQAATIGATQRGSSSAAATAKPTESTMVADALGRLNRGEAPLPGDAIVLKRYENGTGKGKGSGHPLIGVPGSATPPSGAPVRPASDGYPTFTLAQARAAAKVQGNSGRKFHIQGQDGLQVFH